MRNYLFLPLTLLILAGCALQKADRKALPETTTKKEVKVEDKTLALFHVIAPLGVQIVLLKVDTKTPQVVLMDKTLSTLSLKPGFWKVTGFIVKGKRYKIMNTSKQFVFNIEKDKTTYVGSYIFQCPKVTETHVEAMKKMNFFNRYPFSSSQRLCEMVVGSDFDNVNRVWMELEKSQHLPLSLGF